MQKTDQRNADNGKGEGMKMSYAIGIDIGGTKVAIGIVNGDGVVVEQITIPTDLSISPEEMIEKIYRTAAELLEQSGIDKAELSGVGVGAPGPLDAKNGLITCPPNLRNWVNVPIVQELEKHFSLPIRLENDANAAALAEKWVGAAKENNDFAYITISTGIGAGLFVDGKLLSGSKGNAGELGHILVNPAKGTCTCGQKGCLEWVASGTAIGRQASELMGKPLTAKDVFVMYEAGVPEIVSLVEEVFTYIGIGCVSLINLFEPEKIVIGGGVSEVGDPLFDSVRNYVAKYALSPAGRETEIVPAGLRKNAGLIGAAALMFFA